MATKKGAHHLTKSPVTDEIPMACADEQAAIEFFERRRWNGCPCCVHCGSVSVYTIKDRETGERRSDGRWRCRDCGKQYTVRVGNIMEDSPIPLTKWAYAFWCAATAKNGVSALEMSRKLQISYKSALFMMNRIRWAMTDKPNPPKLEGIVEVDETYCGGKPRHRQTRAQAAKSNRIGRGTAKTPVVAVIQRGGDVRAEVVPDVTHRNLRRVMAENIKLGSRIMTDDYPGYRRMASEFGEHGRVRHSLRQYVNYDDPTIHTNTVEGFFSRVKRSLNGTYHAVSKEHLHRYITQCAFMHNTRFMNDGERLAALIRSADGKRLVYRPTGS